MANRGAAGPDLGLILDGGSTAGLADWALLRRASGAGPAAEAAFAALVARHGPMVARTCRGLLGDPHAADDAAQAVFLVLLRKARSVRDPDRLAPWLHGVALRTARAARARAARRHRLLGPPTHPDPEAAMIDPSQPDPATAALDRERAAILHDAVARLPHRYRDAVILCDLQGLTHAEAAAQLNCPVGTVSARLTRARSQLRARLARHRLDLDALAPALAAGSAVAPGLLGAPASTAARALARRVVWAGAAARWQATLAAALVAALAAGGAQAGPGDDPQSPATPAVLPFANRPPEPAPDRTPPIAVPPPPTADAVPPAGKVIVGHPTVRDLRESARFEGRLAASRTQEIQSPVDGYLNDLRTAEGDVVVKGQTLFVVRSHDIQNQVRQREAGIARARAQLDLIRQATKDPGDPAEETLKQQIKSLEAARHEFEGDPPGLPIHAPFAGVVGNLAGAVGQHVGMPERNPALMTLVGDDPIRLDFQVGERDYVRIRRWLATQPDKDAASIGVGVVGEEGFPRQGHARFRTAQFDENGSCTLRAELPNADHALVSGQSARVRVEYGEPRPVLFIPFGAMITTATDRKNEWNFFVLVLGDLNVVRRRQITTSPGNEVGDLICVADGIDARTRIVLNAAAADLGDGEAVPADRIEEAPPTPPAIPPAAPGTRADPPR